MGLFIDPKRRHVHVAKETQGKPAAEQVRATLRVLTAREYETRKDAIRARDTNGDLSVKMGTFVLETLRYGLVGLEGPGVPEWATYQNGYVKDSVLDCLSAAFRSELANAIEELNSVRDDDLLE